MVASGFCFFFLICFGFVLHNSLLLHKISCTHALCIESFHCKLYLTPDRCYTATARCAHLSQLLSYWQHSRVRDSAGQWAMREPLKAQAGLGFSEQIPWWNLIKGPGRACFCLFFGWTIGFDILWSLSYLKRTHACTVGSGWLLCLSWLCSEAQSAPEILNNGIEK